MSFFYASTGIDQIFYKLSTSLTERTEQRATKVKTQKITFFY